MERVSTILLRPDNQPIRARIISLIKYHHDTTTAQVWAQIGEINQLLVNIEPWSQLSPVRLIVAKEYLESHILSLIYPCWITPQQITEDRLFHEKMLSLVPLVTLEFMNLTISPSNQPLIDNAIAELSVMDDHKDQSPMRLLYHIHECCNSLVVALDGYKNNDSAGGADGLVSALVYVIVQAHPKHLISMGQWIEQWSPPTENRSSELFCMYTNLLIAIGYISTLDPDCSIVRVELNDPPPPVLKQRLSEEQYSSIMTQITTANHQIKERAKGAGIGGTIGAIVTSPMAIMLTMATTGIGIPLSIGLVTAGIAIGTTIGALVPLNIRMAMTDLDRCVEQINRHTLQPHGLLLINRNTTLEFVVRSL